MENPRKFREIVIVENDLKKEKRRRRRSGKIRAIRLSSFVVTIREFTRLNVAKVVANFLRYLYTRERCLLFLPSNPDEDETR